MTAYVARNCCSRKAKLLIGLSTGSAGEGHRDQGIAGYTELSDGMGGGERSQQRVDVASDATNFVGRKPWRRSENIRLGNAS